MKNLMGSPKQIAWAKDIRAEVIRMLEKCRYVVEAAAPHKFKGIVKKEYENARCWTENEALAAVFIEKFRYITIEKSDRLKVEDLKKGFGQRFFFNIACKYWYDVTGEG